MYMPLRWFETTLEQTLYYVHTLNVCEDALHEDSVMYGMFQTLTVKVHAKAINLNNQYLTLL